MSCLFLKKIHDISILSWNSLCFASQILIILVLSWKCCVDYKTNKNQRILPRTHE